MKYAAIFTLALCLFVGVVSAADLSTTQGQGQAILNHVGGANITFTNIHTGTTVSSNIIIDGGVMTPNYVGPSVMSTSWGTGPNQTASDVYITHTMGTNGTLKGKIVEKTLHSFSFQLTTPNGEQIVSFPDGSYRIVNNMSDTMDGITIPAPWGIDANGTYIPMHYSQHFPNPTQLDLIFDNTTPIVPPVTIDPTWVATSGFWTSISGTTTSIMCNSTGSVTFTMPSSLISNTISSLVLVGPGGNGGSGTAGAAGPAGNGGLGGNGGGGGGAGTVTTQATYTATGGTQYTLTVGSTGSSTTAFGYTASSGSNGATGGGNAGSIPNGGYGANGVAGYSGYTPLPSTGSGAAGSSGQGTHAGSGGSSGSVATGFGAGGPGAGGGGGGYDGAIGGAGGSPGGAGAPGYITFTYQNTGSSIIPTPVTQFLLNATGGTAPVSVTFTDKTTNATGWSYSYTAYVNGVYSSGPTVFASTQNPTQSFGTAGVNTEYQIMLTAENVSSGKFNTSVQNTWINTTSLQASPVNNETNPNLINGVLPVQFSDTSGAAQNMWNFGDQNPNYLASLSLNILGNLTPFTDSSQYGTTVTQNGSVSLTAGPGGMGSNGGAIYFNGSGGGYLSVPSTNLNFGASSYTLTASVYITSKNATIINNPGFLLTIQNATLCLTTSNATASTSVLGGYIAANIWTPISIIKNSTYITEIINGSIVTQQPISTAYTSVVTGVVTIGGYAGTLAYVANFGGGTVSVINPSTGTVTGTITVGSGPHGVAFNPSGTLAYVVNYGGGTVSVINPSTGTVTGTITVGSEPYGVAFNPLSPDISISNLQIYNGAALPVSIMYQSPPYQYQPGNFGGLPAQIPLTSGNPATHTYTTPNSGYTVTDTAWDQYGGYSQATGTIPVYIGVPYASFTESPTSGQASLLVTFTDTSYRGTASGLSYNWSFGDSSGTNPYSNVIGNTTHVYAYNGVFYPNLTITNANGTSYYVGQPITLSNTQTQTYYLPTQVQLKFTDYNGAPLTGVSVVATPINFSAPAGWINALLGINPNVNIVGTSVGLNTDTLGVCTMPMVQSIEYSIAVKGTSTLNPAETVNTTFNLFPVQTAYEIPLPTNLVPYALPTPQTATTNITYSITNTTGASTQTYTTTYNDATGGTTALQLFVENTTGAWIASSNYTGSAANSETFSQSEPNPNGGTYTWGFLATQSQLGNITQTQTANFPEFINLMGAPGGWPT